MTITEIFSGNQKGDPKLNNSKPSNGKAKKVIAARDKYWHRNKGLQTNHLDWTPEKGF